MRFASVEHEGCPRWGVVEGDEIVLAPSGPGTLREAISNVEVPVDVAAYLGDERVALDSVAVRPPISDPAKIICIGLNYLDHIAETGRDRPVHPVVFTRFADSLVGAGAPLLAPHESIQFDFEGELAVVIGAGGRRIRADDAADHIFGYTILNDGSVRDFQYHTHQFGPGKNFPASGSFGPAIVTADELGEPGPRGELPALTISTSLNGVEVQRSDLGQLCFTVPELIEYVSIWTTLSPGDVIATGTPGGIGSARDPQLWMRPGDRVEVAIDGIGTLSNTVIAEPAP